MNLLQELISKQNQSDMNAREFAAHLGVSHGLWYRILNGTLDMDDKVLAGVLAAYPELEMEVAVYKMAQLRKKAEAVA